MIAINSRSLISQAPLTLEKTSNVQAQEQRTRAVEHEANQSQQTQSDSSKQRLDIDEQAIALVEREQLQSFNSPNLAADRNNANSGYDSPSVQNQSAVATYQSVGAIAQRENVQQVFGVDLFA